jgi:hypothetical protein
MWTIVPHRPATYSVLLDSLQAEKLSGEDESIMMLYHVTPRWNRSGIIERGVDPAKSHGKTPRSWWVSDARLFWAIAHIADYYNLHVNELDVWTTNDGNFRRLVRWPTVGVYYSPFVVFTILVRSASVYVQESHE